MKKSISMWHILSPFNGSERKWCDVIYSMIKQEVTSCMVNPEVTSHDQTGNDIIWSNRKWHHMIEQEVTSYDVTGNDIILSNMKWHDQTGNDVINDETGNDV